MEAKSQRFVAPDDDDNRVDGADEDDDGAAKWR